MSHTTTYSTYTGDLVIEFDYQPAERMTRDYPGCDAEVDVVSVMANGIDILEWISDVSLEFFVEKCFESVAEAKENDEYDRGEERYQSRMDDACMGVF